MIEFLNKADKAISKTVRTLASICMMIVFVLFLLTILKKYVSAINFVWLDEIVELFLIYMIFLSAAELVRTGEHFMVDILTDKMQGKLIGKICRLISVVISLVFFAIVAYYGFHATIKNTQMMSSIVWMPRKVYYAAIPLSACLMTIYSVRDVILAVLDFKKK